MAETLHLLAAGSLARAFADPAPVRGHSVSTRFGASGLLRRAIVDGAPWDVFVSADTAHPGCLHRIGRGMAPQIVCHNALCLLLRPELSENDPATLLLRPDLRLGISTPGNDPSGDYALAALRRLNDIVPGAGDAAALRALRLTGAPELPTAPEGRNTYAWLLTEGAADLCLTYRTNAILARADTPTLRMLDLPAGLGVRASYALTTRTGAHPAATTLAEQLLAAPMQGRLRDLGFEPAHPAPAQPSPA